MGQQSDIIIYQSDDGITRIETRLENETVWLTQGQMAELFQKGRMTITEHIKNVFEEGELEESMVCRNFRHTTQHGAIEEKTKDELSKSEEDFVAFIDTTAKSLESKKKQL